MKKNKRRRSTLKKIEDGTGTYDGREPSEIVEILDIYDPDASENRRSEFWDVASPVLKSKWCFLSE